MKPETVKYIILAFIFIFAGTAAWIANKIAEKNTSTFRESTAPIIPPLGNKIVVAKVAGIKQGSEVLIGGEWVKVTRRLGTTLWVKPIAKTRG